MSDIRSAPAVVVGIDGSKAAINAARWAIDEAVSRDVPLRLVYVVDPLHGAGADNYAARLAAARTALQDASRAVAATGKEVKVETDITQGRSLTRLMEETRSAAMVCVGSIGINHACRAGGSTAAALAQSALCPVAVIRQPSGGLAPPQINTVVAEVDNGTVLRHAFEEARLRGATLRAIAVSRTAAPDGGNGLAQAQLSRRIARWTRLYPDVPVEASVVSGSLDRYLATDDEPNQLVVTDSHACQDLCGAYNAGRSVLAIRSNNL